MKRKFILILLVVFAIVNLNLISNVYASESKKTNKSKRGDITFESTPQSGGGTKDVDLDDYKVEQINGANKLQSKSNVVIGAITTIGVVVSVVALIGIGIRYMLSSVEEKADIKGTLVPYIIGACLVFATSVIVGIIFDFGRAL